MQLSKNFNLVELTKSQTATRKGIDNTPSPTHQANLQSLCMHVLQPIRDHFSQVVTVSSGYRSQELCLAIGSKITSQHAKGEAADFEIFGVSNNEIFNWITVMNTWMYDQMISRILERDQNPTRAGCMSRTILIQEGNNIKQIFEERIKTKIITLDTNPSIGDA